MKNLFKKLLACCLAVCMVLTLCVGAITVGAEAPTGTVTAGTAKITDADTEAVVPVTAYAAGGIAAAEINVAVPENLTISGLELVTTDTKVEVTFASAANPSGAPELLDSNVATSDVAPNVIDGVFTYIIHLPANTVTTAEVTVNITFAGEYAVGDPIAVDIVDAEACYDAQSDLINLTITDGSIEVTAAHTCAPAETVVENEIAATCYAEGSYDEVVYCSCGKELSRTAKTIEKIAHTPATAVVENEVAATCYEEGSYDSVVYCSVEACKAEISRTPVTVDKTEHTPATAVVENEVPATCLAAGSYDSVVYCSVEACKTEISRTTLPIEKLDHDYTYTDNKDGTHSATCPNGCAGITGEAHNYVDGTCVCGAKEAVVAVPDSKLKFMARSAAIQDTLSIGYVVSNSAFSNYDHIEVEVTATKYDNNRNITTKVEVLPNRETASYVMATYSGISMFELDLNVSAVIKAYDAQGNFVAYSSTTYNDTPKSLLVTLYNSSNTNVETKTMITDMFNLGAAAQAYYAKAGSALESATPINEGWSQEYASQGEPVLEAAAAPVWDANSPLSSADITFTPGINLAGTPALAYIITDKKSKLDVSKFRLDVEYDVVLPSAFAGTRPDSFSKFTTFSNMHTAIFSKITLADSNCPVTAKLYYDGKLVLTSVYTMNAGMKEKIESTSSNAKMVALSKALALFGASARAKFGV